MLNEKISVKDCIDTELHDQTMKGPLSPVASCFPGWNARQWPARLPRPATVPTAGETTAWSTWAGAVCILLT